MRIVISGAGGLIGWHAAVRLHAANCAARFKGEAEPFDVIALSHTDFDNDGVLFAALQGAQAVLHFAGVNRASDYEIEAANSAIATRLADACNSAGVKPHVVYANSTHSASNTPYGRSKRKAGKILEAIGGEYTDLILPHIFGECAKPFYNNVTATLIAQIIAGEASDINPDGQVQLMHAGAAAQFSIDAAIEGMSGRFEPAAHPISVPDLYKTIADFHVKYLRNVYPDLSNRFDRDLFNSYRAASYPDSWPRTLDTHTDLRGTLFEAVKGGGGGQSFISSTKPGVTRGNHFHLHKVERFLVLQGEAKIRIRKVLNNEVWEYRVSGGHPAPIDMPTLHTHSIENVGDTDLLTLFWTHDLFDPVSPDTYFDEVVK